jgi:hypothetical protein
MLEACRLYAVGQLDLRNRIQRLPGLWRFAAVVPFLECLLFFSWAICMIAFFMWMIYAAMPNPKPDLRFSFAANLETFRKDFGTSRNADLLPPVPLSAPPVKPPISLPVFSPPDRLVANGPLPVSGCLRSLCVSLSQANDLKTVGNSISRQPNRRSLQT